jgi:hypothetical protein
LHGSVFGDISSQLCIMYASDNDSRRGRPIAHFDELQIFGGHLPEPQHDDDDDDDDTDDTEDSPVSAVGPAVARRRALLRAQDKRCVLRRGAASRRALALGRGGPV